MTEDAISPVIGTILLVAITCILATIVSAMVFGMANNTQPAKIIGLTVSTNQSGYGVAMIYGGNLASVTSINASVGSSTESILFKGDNIAVGNKANISQKLTGQRLVLIGVGDDGSRQVLFERQY